MPQEHAERAAGAGDSRVVLPPPPPRVVAPSAASVAADYIRTLIFDGVLRNGERVLYDEIADRLQVSRQPVREAILELETDGLVVTRPKRGTFVGPFNARTVREHHAAYGLLEGYAARQVAVAHDAQVNQHLRRLCAEAAAATSPVERVACARRFLNVIDTAGSGGRLLALLHQISRFVPPKFFAEHVTGAQELIGHSLEPIMTAIEAGDPDAAAEAVQSMWTEAGDRLVDHLYEAGVFTGRHDAAM